MAVEIAQLHAVPFTMLMTFAARLASSEATPGSSLYDPWGSSVLKQLPWDLTPYQEDQYFVRLVALRSGLMDRLTTEFFRRNPGSAGVNLGCGLCTRGRRVHNGRMDGFALEWYDIDLAEVIELRRKYLPPLPGEHLMACSVTDMSWFDRVTRSNALPLILVMEGVSPYLTTDQNRFLFNVLGSRLEGTGTEMIFDCIHPALVDSGYVSNKAGGTTTPFCSGFCDANAVRNLHPSIEVISEHSTFSQVSRRHKVFEMEFDAASLGQKPYNILHIRFGGHG